MPLRYTVNRFPESKIGIIFIVSERMMSAICLKLLLSDIIGIFLKYQHEEPLF